MSKNFWIRGNREKKEQIETSIRKLLEIEHAVSDRTPLLLINTDDPDTLIVYDGVRKTICYLGFDSAIAQAIMESSNFKELLVPFTQKPRFNVGDTIFSKVNPEKQYKILGTGDMPHFSTKETYLVELLTTEFKGLKRYIDIETVDDFGELAPTQDKAKQKVMPKYKVGQTVLFDGSVLTIHRIIEGYYLFNKEGSRGCRIDQQDKFIELKFKVGDYLRHKKTGGTATVASIDSMYYHVHGWSPIPIKEQDEWMLFNDHKFNIGDLVVYRDLIGRVNDVIWQDHFGWAYKVGNIIDIHECDLCAADHRDEVRILNRKSK